MVNEIALYSISSMFLCAGAKVIIIGWVMDLMTMLEDLGKSKGCRGRKSLPLPLAPCTVCAALRTVGGSDFVTWRCVTMGKSCTACNVSKN